MVKTRSEQAAQAGAQKESRREHPANRARTDGDRRRKQLREENTQQGYDAKLTMQDAIGDTESVSPHFRERHGQSAHGQTTEPQAVVNWPTQLFESLFRVAQEF